MPLHQTMSGIPADQVDGIVENLRLQGATVHKHQAPDGTWTITAIRGEPPADSPAASASAAAPTSGAPAAAPPGPTIADDSLGAIARKFESTADPGAVGEDRVGGPSYGIYQIATKTGTMAEFLRFLDINFEAFHAKLEAAGGAHAALAKSGEFVAAWRELARNPDFSRAQHEFIEKTHYAKLKNRLLRIGLDVVDRSRPLKEAVWSVSVQHGPATDVIKNAIDDLPVPSNLADKQIIEAIYDERSKVDTYFKNSTPQVKTALVKRFKAEKEELTSMLA